MGVVRVERPNGKPAEGPDIVSAAIRTRYGVEVPRRAPGEPRVVTQSGNIHDVSRRGGSTTSYQVENGHGVRLP